MINHKHFHTSKKRIFKMNLHLFTLNPGLYFGYFFCQTVWAASPFVCSYLIGLLFDGLEIGVRLLDLYVSSFLLLFVHLVGIYLIRKAGLIDILIQFTVGRKLRNNILRLMINSYSFKTDNVGMFLDVLNYDVTALQFMLLTQLDLLSQLFFLSVALIILCYMNVMLTLFVIAPIILLSYFVWLVSEKYKSNYSKKRNSSMDNSRFISESITNHEVLQFFSDEESDERKCREHCEKKGRMGLRSAMMESLLASSSELVGHIGITVIMLCLAVFQSVQGLSIGQFTIIAGFMGYGCSFLHLFGEVSFGFREGEVSLERVENCLSTSGIQTITRDVTKMNRGELEPLDLKTDIALISFRNFRLVEEDRPHNFVLEQGDVVVVTGANGSGKTWLIEAILGYAPHYGEVIIHQRGDDTRIGYVPQVTHLFDASVEENISMFTKDASVEQVAFISNIDVSLLTSRDKVGVNGKELSEGQRQRISIARAIFDYSGIVIMDAPFAYLDKENRKSIFEKIVSPHQVLVIVSNDVNIMNRANILIEMNQMSMTLRRQSK